MRAEAADAYARRVRDAGGALVQQAQRVARQFGVALDEDAARDITRLLAERGVGVDPALGAVTGRDFVELYAVDREPQRQPEDTPTARRAALDAATEAAASGAGATAVLVGAAATSGLFVLIGFAGHWLYGLIYLLLAAVGLAILRYRLRWVGRSLLPRFGWLRFGWMLGAVPMLAAALLVSLLVVAPIAAERGERARERDAERALALADRSIADGDLHRARQHLEQAERRDPDAPGLDTVERRLERATLAAAEERRNRRRYEGAIADFEESDYRTAIGNLEALGDYRDAADLVERYRAVASRRFLAKARRAYDPADPEAALAIAREADRFASSPTTRRFVADTRTQLIAVRRERARQRRIAAEKRRAEREYQAQLRQAEREAERRAPPPPSDYDYGYDAPAAGGGKGTPCDNGWTVNWCGASRDGDSDGCWCEE